MSSKSGGTELFPLLERFESELHILEPNDDRLVPPKAQQIHRELQLAHPAGALEGELEVGQRRLANAEILELEFAAQELEVERILSHTIHVGAQQLLELLRNIPCRPRGHAWA